MFVTLGGVEPGRDRVNWGRSALVDDRLQNPCNLPGKHHCRCAFDDDLETAPLPTPLHPMLDAHHQRHLDMKSQSFTKESSLPSSSKPSCGKVLSCQLEVDSVRHDPACGLKANSCNEDCSEERTGMKPSAETLKNDIYTHDRTIPSALDKAKFRRSFDSAASMVFHSRTGLPLTSSPAPVRRGTSRFDFDSSLNSVSAIRRGYVCYHPKRLCMLPPQEAMYVTTPRGYVCYHPRRLCMLPPQEAMYVTTPGGYVCYHPRRLCMLPPQEAMYVTTPGGYVCYHPRRLCMLPPQEAMYVTTPGGYVCYHPRRLCMLPPQEAMYVTTPGGYVCYHPRRLCMLPPQEAMYVTTPGGYVCYHPRRLCMLPPQEAMYVTTPGGYVCYHPRRLCMLPPQEAMYVTTPGGYVCYHPRRLCMLPPQEAMYVTTPGGYVCYHPKRLCMLPPQEAIALFETGTVPTPDDTMSVSSDDAESEGSAKSPCSPGVGLMFIAMEPLPWSCSSSPCSSLLGSFEESVLNGRLEPVSTVQGFTAELGASGSFCPRHRILPVTVFFYTIGDNDKVSTPYLGHINLGKKGYHVPRCGTIQVTLFNPLGTVIKMFVVMYDLTDMPASSQTFLRQRTLYMPAFISNTASLPDNAQKWLRYLIHLRFSSSKSGRIHLHSDIRMIIFRKSDLDTATAHGMEMSYELRSFTHGPTNPKFSSRK
uniref:Atos-like conserved domain-containing protein n=1 Tax=Timema genevievae TaxID=629358 RepID=A0A7R9JWJ3_TIMGE|nr:unnamed protein product [Timema genevievae]